MSTIIRELTDIQGVEVSAPTENPFTASGLEVFATDAAYEVVRPSPGAGEFYFNSTFGAVRIYNGTAWQFDKTTFSAQTDSTSTGANQDITPNTFDQIIRFTGGSLTSIRSLVPTNQRVVYLFNGQASNGITLVNESGVATAANRILTGNGKDYVLQTNQIVKLVYDEDASRWRLFDKPMTGLESFASDAEYVTAHNPPVAGSRYWNTTSLVVREYNGSAWLNNKVLFSTENNTALTGADQNVTPATDQIIKLSNASLTSIAGINPSVHKFLVLINGTGAALSIKNESSAATGATYRVLTGTGVDLSMRDGSSILLAYDDNSSRWRVTGGSGSGGSSVAATNCCQSPNDVSIQWSAALQYGWYSSAATAASTTTTAAECPLAPILNTAIKITRTTVGSYDSYRWKMPAALKQNTIPISWLQIVESGSAAGDFKLDVYTYTDAAYTTGATRKNLRSDSSSITSIPAYTGFFGSNNAYSFDTGSEDYYEMRITRVSGTKYLCIAGLKIGFGDIGVVGADGEYENTTTFTVGATTTPPTPGTGITYLRNTYRVGRWAIIRYEIRQAAAGSAGTGDYLLPLPNNLSIDYSRAGYVSTSSWNGEVGEGTLLVASTVFEAKGCIANSGSYANKIHVMLCNETTALTTWSSSLGTFANSTLQLSLTVRVPIVGWDDAVILAPGNISEYGSGAITSDANTTTYTYSPQGSRVPTVGLSANRYVEITWPSPSSIDSKFDLEIDYNGDGRWCPHDSNEYGSLVYQSQNTNGYGMYFTHVSSTVTRVYFAVNAYASGASYGAAGTAWLSLVSTVRWRLRRWKAGIPVGIEHGQFHGGAQLYRAGYAPGLNTGVAIGAGYVGQKITSGSVSVNLISGQHKDVASIALTSGVWLLTFRGEIVGSNASQYYSFFCGGTVAGNNSTGSSYENYVTALGVTPVSGAQIAFCIANYYLNITTATTTTYYAKVFQASGTANDARGVFEAVRIA